MPTYVYACKVKSHPRQEIVHKMSENPSVKCGECHKPMHRVPQPLLSVNFNAQHILADWMDENYRRWRTKRPRFSPDLVKRPGKPIPAQQYRSRTNVKRKTENP